jgi:hypothetical protein
MLIRGGTKPELPPLLRLRVQSVRAVVHW